MYLTCLFALQVLKTLFHVLVANMTEILHQKMWEWDNDIMLIQQLLFDGSTKN